MPVSVRLSPTLKDEEGRPLIRVENGGLREYFTREEAVQMARSILRLAKPPSSGRMRGGKARMDQLTPEERKQFARKGAEARWGNGR